MSKIEHNLISIRIDWFFIQTLYSIEHQYKQQTDPSLSYLSIRCFGAHCYFFLPLLTLLTPVTADSGRLYS